MCAVSGWCACSEGVVCVCSEGGMLIQVSSLLVISPVSAILRMAELFLLEDDPSLCASIMLNIKYC